MLMIRTRESLTSKVLRRLLCSPLMALHEKVPPDLLRWQLDRGWHLLASRSYRYVQPTEASLASKFHELKMVPHD
jgi:hypothetical protein